MPIEIWKSDKGRTWYWTAFARNSEVVADSAEGYSSKAKAEKGALAAARELAKWLEEIQKKPEAKKKARKASPKPSRTSARRKPAGKVSSSSSKPTRTKGTQSA